MQNQTGSTKSSSPLALWAGYLLMAIPVIHMFLAVWGSHVMWQNLFSEGLWNTVAAPWTAEDVVRQRNFWTQVGSFSVPMFILGTSIVWIASRNRQLPSFLGWSLLVYSFGAGFLAPVGGFWSIAIPGFLLIMHTRRYK
ncbi:DUF6463 family protein [Bacillus sp. 03113]|uniref:DUF6463 family protein n=1 Tax=Bacillus sp. 03113 TaxID=2578211 RepID=UPI0011419E1A|nr:DUF6463 family protein [Bacillus sp. 03113]